MGAAPEGPRDNGGGFDLAPGQACDDTANFLHRPADQHRLVRIIRRLLFGGAGVLAWRRMAASIAKASMTSETWRCQPCQERVSLWSRPSSSPAFAGAGFGCLEAVLDGPALSFDSDHHRKRGAGGTPGG